MKINKCRLKGFRNFKDCKVRFNGNTLIIGPNDVGKTNLVRGLRLLLDKSLSERDIEPQESDFFISTSGDQTDSFTITIWFSEVKEDAVLSVLKEHVSDSGKTVLRIISQRNNLSYRIYAGLSTKHLQEITSRFYLKFLNLKYVKSQRDLVKFVESEKKQLLKLSAQGRDDAGIAADEVEMAKISSSLANLNDKIGSLSYVKNATDSVNEELKKLSYNHEDYSVNLDSGAIETHHFIDNLKLGATQAGAKLLLGGDGRNNQILLALWKAKSQREYNPEHEVVFYCVEEPEAHLHPHQQRRLANYLINELPGQTLLTTHSPQIVSRYKPDSIINLVSRTGESTAASKGCSPCIADSWENLGYRMSILPAEAYFSNCVLLVEGPSEELFYAAIAKYMAIDLDFYNISILSVNGVAFNVYTEVLNAMEVPWVARTDNDISRTTTNKQPRSNLAGMNRALSLAGLEKLAHEREGYSQADSINDGKWASVFNDINKKNIFLSQIDLEHDLASELPESLLAYSGKEDIQNAIEFLQSKKAIKMREFILSQQSTFASLSDGDLIKPLLRCVNLVG